MREMLEETEGGARALRVRIQLAGWSPEGARARARRSAPASARPTPPSRSDALPDSARPVQSREERPRLSEKVDEPVRRRPGTYWAVTGAIGQGFVQKPAFPDPSVDLQASTAVQKITTFDLRSRPTVLASGRRNSLSPVLEEVRERPLERDLGLPPERLVNLRRVPFQHHHVGRTEPRRLHP